MLSAVLLSFPLLEESLGGLPTAAASVGQRHPLWRQEVDEEERTAYTSRYWTLSKAVKYPSGKVSVRKVQHFESTLMKLHRDLHRRL